LSASAWVVLSLLGCWPRRMCRCRFAMSLPIRWIYTCSTRRRGVVLRLVVGCRLGLRALLVVRLGLRALLAVGWLLVVSVGLRAAPMLAPSTVGPLPSLGSSHTRSLLSSQAASGRRPARRRHRDLPSLRSWQGKGDPRVVGVSSGCWVVGLGVGSRCWVVSVGLSASAWVGLSMLDCRPRRGLSSRCWAVGAGRE
jgi:hypothetical protein